MTEPNNADPILVALAERDRLESIHNAAITKTDSLQFAGDRPAYEAAQAEQDKACCAARDFEDEVLEMRPKTVSGALALLRFVATIGRDSAGREREKSDAIQACADLLDRQAQKGPTSPVAVEATERSAYDLAGDLRDRARGVACLMQAAFEHGGTFDCAELQGIARLAADLADGTNQVFEQIRKEELRQQFKEGRMSAEDLERLLAL